MFLESFLDRDSYLRLLDKYEVDYLNSLDISKFKKIYKIFCDNKFYFINDLIIKYLELFFVDEEIIKKAICSIVDTYGSEYVYIIGNDLNILDDAVAEIMEDNI